MSKVFSRSIKQVAIRCLALIAQQMSDVSLFIAWIVECLCRKPNWFSGITLFIAQKTARVLFMTILGSQMCSSLSEILWRYGRCRSLWFWECYLVVSFGILFGRLLGICLGRSVLLGKRVARSYRGLFCRKCFYCLARFWRTFLSCCLFRFSSWYVWR